ncbi:GNAT family N-acetyltransferase [Pseudonocardia sp. TRM90224]|uniref:GNAT family N-acetyltransferase n=1 Tax=Pseudonocardia sp. TRM90224 TaxID=2812678 RepID=UPI001E45869C|nr:GNAT family N-acetyltransferase [Pseudonocardia sp. TRM90224]
MPQPTLHTERLLLVPLAEQHIELEVELDSDPEVMRFLTGRASTRAEVLASHARRMALGRQVDGLGFWMAFEAPKGDPAGDEFVGLMMLPPAHGPDQPDDPTVSDLGYRLLRRHWRKGLAGEASRALLRHAFDTVGQSRVIAQTMAVNTASRALMTSVGMRHVRTYYPQWDDPLPGSEQGEVEYEITRAMWRS